MGLPKTTSSPGGLRTSRLLIPTALILIAGIVVAQVAIPIGWALAGLYVMPVTLVALWTSSRQPFPVVWITMICTILGGVPLVLAAGAGAEARIALGWVIVGGLGLATVSTLFLTPVAYLLLGRFVTPKMHEEARLKRELEEAAYTNIEPAE